jgi:hypothetical protein
MENAQFIGGPQDGTVLQIASPVPVLLFPAHRKSPWFLPSGPPSRADMLPAVRYRLRLAEDGFPCRGERGQLAYDFAGDA